MKAITEMITLHSSANAPTRGNVKQRYRRKAALVTVLALAMTSEALQATTMFPSSFNNSYYVSGVPDFDQERVKYHSISGLPGEGKMYCIPTASMNWLAWLASNRSPDVLPFEVPSNWESDSVYEDVTQTIELLGDLMQTDPDDGTGGNNARDGLKEWFRDNNVKEYTVYNHYGYTDPGRLGDQTILGGLVSIAMGFYEEDESLDNTYTRSGGHVMTMTSLNIVPSVSLSIVGVHDPASDEDDYQSQSAFNDDLYDFEESDGTFTDGWITHTNLYKVEGYGTSDRAYLDGYLVIKPSLFLLHDWAHDSSVVSAVPAWESGGQSYTVNIPEGVIDAALSPANTEIMYLAAATATQPAYLGAANLVDDRHMHLVDDRHMHLVDDRHMHLADVPGALSLTTGRFDEAYVLYRNGRHLMKVTMSDNPEITSRRLPYTFRSIVYDDINDYIIGMSATRNSLVVLDRDLNITGTLALPNTVSVTGESTLGISPVTGNVFIASPSTSRVHELAYRTGEQGTQPYLERVSVIRNSELAMATGISVNDLDHVFVSTSSGTALEFEKTTLGNWRRQKDDLGNLQMVRLYQVSTSRSNYDPEQMADPLYGNAN